MTSLTSERSNELNKTELKKRSLYVAYTRLKNAK